MKISKANSNSTEVTTIKGKSYGTMKCKNCDTHLELHMPIKKDVRARKYCTLCDYSIHKFEYMWYCPQGETDKHRSGYAVCYRCELKERKNNTKKQF